MTKSTDTASIAHNVFEYLTSQGFSLTIERKKELLARLFGYDSDQQFQANQDKAKVFYVSLLSFNDILPAGYVAFGRPVEDKPLLLDTLTQAPLGQFGNAAEAHVFAAKQAARMKRPVVVFDGNVENIVFFDEPAPEYQAGYEVLEALGEVKDGNAWLANCDMAEDFNMLDCQFLSLRGAIGYLRTEAERQNVSGRLYLVTLSPQRVVQWRFFA